IIFISFIIVFANPRLRLSRFRNEMSKWDNEFVARTPLLREPLHSDVVESEISRTNKEGSLSTSLFEGDIQLTDDQLTTLISSHDSQRLSKRQTVTQLATSWGRDPIPFTIYNISDHVRETFKNAINHWQNITCVRFIENGQGNDRVSIYANEGCSSTVGRVGGDQTMSLADSCKSLGTVIHEVEHLLGVFHTQSRVDRDSFVTLLTENILPGSEHDFEKYPSSETLGIPYEYGSLLHYSDTLFSSNGQPTLLSSNPSYQKSMGSHLPSFYDTALINKFYGCYDNCNGIHIVCENGGVQDVNDCSRCLCPQGYGGRFCEGDPDGCLQILSARESVQKATISVGENSKTMKTNYDTCSYVFKPSSGYKVQIRIEALAGAVSSSCVYAGLEVKTKIDARPRGIRHCTTDLPSPWYISGKSYFYSTIYFISLSISEGDRLSIHSWSLYGPFQAQISYQSIPQSDTSSGSNTQDVPFCSMFKSLCESINNIM
ncbi:hypothetical protein PRIPAC_90286, partial [Pristionchus pacificus]